MQYTIRRGDTLSALAKRYNTSVSALARANNIKDPDKIYAGDTLYVPDAGAQKQVQEAYIVPYTAQAGQVFGSGGTGVKDWSKPQGADTYTGAAPAWGGGGGYASSWGEDPAGALAGALEKLETPAYTSAYADKIDAVRKEIEDRAPFSYDHNEDPLYHGYRDSYLRAGRLAMQDAMGQAAALTGGYGSSYAQSVGQQAYGSYMQALADRIPELEAQAYEKYRDEGDALYERLAAYGALEEDAYGRYRDTVEDAQDARAFLYGQYRDAQEDALARYEAELEAQRYAQELAYKREQDAREQANWEREMAYKREQDAREQANWQAEYERKNTASSSAASSSPGRSKSAAGAAQSGSASPADDTDAAEIYALFESMTARERRAMLDDETSVAYIRAVLGESGYDALRTRFGA